VSSLGLGCYLELILLVFWVFREEREDELKIVGCCQIIVVIDVSVSRDSGVELAEAHTNRLLQLDHADFRCPTVGVAFD